MAASIVKITDIFLSAKNTPKSIYWRKMKRGDDTFVMDSNFDKDFRDATLLKY